MPLEFGGGVRGKVRLVCFGPLGGRVCFGVGVIRISRRGLFDMPLNRRWNRYGEGMLLARCRRDLGGGDVYFNICTRKIGDARLFIVNRIQILIKHET